MAVEKHSRISLPIFSLLQLFEILVHRLMDPVHQYSATGRNKSVSAYKKQNIKRTTSCNVLEKNPNMKACFRHGSSSQGLRISDCKMSSPGPSFNHL